MKTDTIDWKEQATLYIEQYGGNTDGIIEWIDGMVPHYYYDIMMEANRHKLYHEDIISNDVGCQIWEVLQRYIYIKYEESFMMALNEVREEIYYEEE